MYGLESIVDNLVEIGCTCQIAYLAVGEYIHDFKVEAKDRLVYPVGPVDEIFRYDPGHLGMPGPHINNEQRLPADVIYAPGVPEHRHVGNNHIPLIR